MISFLSIILIRLVKEFSFYTSFDPQSLYIVELGLHAVGFYRIRFKCKYCSSTLVQSYRTHIYVLFYLGNLEEPGIITSENVSDHVC